MVPPEVPGLARNFSPFTAFPPCSVELPENPYMNGIIYLIGLIVVIMAILSLLGLR